MTEPLSERPSPGVTRRWFLQKGGIVAADIATRGTLLSLALQACTPETSNSSPTEFGLNTHLFLDKSGKPDLVRFKSAVDDHVRNNLSYIRFNLSDQLISPQKEVTELQLDSVMLSTYYEAIAYAKDKGLTICLVTNTPGNLSKLPDEAYKEQTRAYYKELASRYTGKVGIWQIFNEPDVHRFRDYGGFENQDKAYLQSLSELVAIANTEIKSSDPNAKTTVNVSGWPLNRATLERFERFFDAVAPHIDIVTLDLYAQPETLDKIPLFIQTMKSRYGKPVIIGEYGVTTGDGQYSEGDQTTMVMGMTDRIKASKPQAALIYEYDDEAHLSNPHEAKFGIKENPEFQDILNRLSSKDK